MEKAKLKKTWGKVGLILALVLLGLVLVGLIAVVVIGNYVFDKIGSAETQETFATIPPESEVFETDPPEDTLPTEETVPGPSQDATGPSNEATQPVETQPTQTQPPETRPNFAWPEVEQLKDDQVTNILLIGQDARKPGERARSDTMILLSINKRTGTLSLTSLMRDMYVQIPGGYSDNRINASYFFGGKGLLNATIQKNFGITVDGNVEVGFDQFCEIVDILGGVEVELTEAEAKHMQSLGYKVIQPGVNRLNGTHALDYCRIRKIDSDHNRTERQRKLLTAIAESARSMNISQAMALVDKVLPYVYTDLSESQILDVATSTLSILAGGGTIQSGKVPQSGQYYGAMIMGMSVIVPDLNQCHQYLKTTIYGW